tara:strand:+ start:2388 stop:4148 length:1761 start_codon:yes stop_codon:yes gene_type:complete
MPVVDADATKVLAALRVEIVGGRGRWRVRSFVGMVFGFALGWAVQGHWSVRPRRSQGKGRRSTPLVDDGRAASSEQQPPPTASQPTVALCVGGLLELTIPQRGQSVADHVVKVLKPDIFLTGTLKSRPTPKRIAHAVDAVGALRPFTRVSVIRMPTVQDLRQALKSSGHWDDFTRTAQGKGSGQLPGGPADIRKWLPLATSPVFGNPKGNTLQELHYQSRCIGMVAEHEQDERRGKQYERVMFTRLEFEWLHDHPPLSLLDAPYLWLPTGEDNEGVNDRHWLANRKDAEVVFRRWDSLLDGAEYRRLFGTEPMFVSSEIFMGRALRRHGLKIARFPSVAMLQCCAINYLDAAARMAGNLSELQCFARRCNEVPCPSRAIGACTQSTLHDQLDALAEAAATQVGFDAKKGFTGFVAGLRAPGQKPVLAFKYEYEGRAAIMHATALSFPDAHWHRPADSHPPRLDIALPATLGSRLAPDAMGSSAGEPPTAQQQQQQQHSYFYSCMRCNVGTAVGCLDPRHTYDTPQLEASRKGKAPCLYYDPAPMAALCAMHEDAERNFEFYWWCHGVERHVVRSAVHFAWQRKKLH